MEQMMRELLLFGVMFVAVLLIIGAMVSYAKFLEWREQCLSTVKSSRIVMSRAAEDAPENVPSSLRQTEPQTDRQPITREIMLDMYKMLREYGVPRERARAILKAAGLPLDNNLWTQAAPPPPEEPQQRTPIAGRPTSAQFSDPELAYQPPPR